MYHIHHYVQREAFMFWVVFFYCNVHRKLSRSKQQYSLKPQPDTSTGGFNYTLGNCSVSYLIVGLHAVDVRPLVMLYHLGCVRVFCGGT